jgi:hypothetical protein
VPYGSKIAQSLDIKAPAAKRFVGPDPKHVTYRGSEAKKEEEVYKNTDSWIGGQGRYWGKNPSSDMPGWLAVLLVEAAMTCNKANNNSPHVSIVNDRVKNLYGEWDAAEHISGTHEQDKYASGSHNWVGKARDTSSTNGVYMPYDEDANEDKFTRGGEEIIVFVTSLLDMVK